MADAGAGKRILERMLERLFASVLNGPAMNCRPHNSRQRIDWCQLAGLRDVAPSAALRALLSDALKAELIGRVDQPAGESGNGPRKTTDRGGKRGRRRPDQESPAEPPTRPPAPPAVPDSTDIASPASSASPAADDARGESEPDMSRRDPAEPDGAAAEAGGSLTDEERAERRRAEQAWNDQKAVFTKLRVVAEDAKTYLDDTGVHVLSVGFPILSIPPGAWSGRGGATTRRILAPIAFIPVNLKLVGGGRPSLEVECREDEVDRVTANAALFAWLEQQTGKVVGELFRDEEGSDPWRELGDLVQRVATLLNIEAPAALRGEPPGEDWQLLACPRADDDVTKLEILSSAVLGLYPMSNQALIRDTQALLGGELPDGPIRNFLDVRATLDDDSGAAANPIEKRTRQFAEERLVSAADPCQSRAVRLARQSRVLVVHGPPGTGKSQTITNVIGDHLAAGQRVLFVCDKRTALDVVANRLEHLGLGGLCAVIHDPQRDQRDLYTKLREQLESLGERRSDSGAAATVGRLDGELAAIHSELTDNWRELMQPPTDGGAAFHELVGSWLATPVEAKFDGIATDAQVRLTDLEQHGLALQDIFRRAETVDYAHNPWSAAVGVSVADLVGRPAAEIRAAVARLVEPARATDATRHEAIPPFDAQRSMREQGAARVRLADELQSVVGDVPAELRRLWATRDAASVRAAAQRLEQMSEPLKLVTGAALDGELALMIGDRPPALLELNGDLAALDAYLAVAGTFRHWFAFGVNKPARVALARYGLALSTDAAKRGRAFLAGVRARMLLHALLAELAEQPAPGALRRDEELRRGFDHLRRTLSLLERLHGDEALASVRSAAAVVLEGEPGDVLLDGLRRSGPRGEAIEKLVETAGGTKLISNAWIAESRERLARGGLADEFEALHRGVDDLEDIARMSESLAALPRELRSAVARLCSQAASQAEYHAALVARTFRHEIARRLSMNKRLASVDAHRLQTMFERYDKLSRDKSDRVGKAIVHYWVSRQQERLMAGTLSRMNSTGADLRRRLTLRGKNAMRLRQVIGAGERIEGGDPLFDLAPVWMASPETVAQIFPLAAQFDVVVFDESSQCRLEEALPVLVRGRRVVIAGDPKQLPPTRFFESGLVQSEAEDVASDQELFEVQQKEVEDLLAAALSLDVQQSYLDVHYRSRNSDLIGFSNIHFYGSRLQPIPGHPNNRTRYAPISIYRADGVYHDRANEAEALKVVQIIHDLLRRATPPSIGVACFNMTQRDLISEKLSEAAAADADFATKLTAARHRQGEGSFEGLFVKNLENVQGDERDHIIISTTYGPDEKGRFYRRFGPLGSAGGGRRLNVLITRARHEVHLVTSIPREVYQDLPPVPQGQAPNGGWLLLQYLAQAERLAEHYAESSKAADEAAHAGEHRIAEWPTKHPSAFSGALARRLAREFGVGSTVNWGNDAFMVDVALAHPERVDDVTIGVLTDWNRFDAAADPVEWEVFRTAVLQSQGWSLSRVWTTAFLRDEHRVVAELRKQAAQVAEEMRPRAPEHEL